MVVIIDYGLGNLRSVAGAVHRLGHQFRISRARVDLEAADRLILPGVGAFGDGMKNLHDLDLVALLGRLVLEEKKPILGICLGCQLLARESFEFGHHAGLGWIDASVIRLEPPDTDLRVPHVGWNDLLQTRPSSLWEGVPADALFYYVHSFHLQCRDEAVVTGECPYGNRFVAAVQKGNIHGTQFHPEKSQLHGLTVLRNFLERG
jgi:imidazole glycerol-phosphate synthase subunit HisH